MSEDTTVRTAISPSYVPGWGMVECLRELIQEALDLETSGHRIRVSHRGRYALVEDWGPGLKREHLALGRSEKRDRPDLIGNFGEGLKLAALVAARMGRKMVIETVGFSARPQIDVDPGLQCEVLMFDLGPSRRAKGTVVKVEASKAELQEAKARFLRWVKGVRKKQTVFLPGGRVYINGALAATDENLLFSYNIQGGEAKKAQNRDRNVLDHAFLREHVTQAVESLKNPKLIAEFLRALSDNVNVLETSLCPTVEPKVESVWRRVATKIIGSPKKVVLSSESPCDIEAERLGFKVRKGDSYHLRNVLAQLGYRNSYEVARLRLKRWRRSVLSAEEKALLDAAVRAVKQGYRTPGRIAVTDVDDLSIDGSSVPAMYDRKKDVIWLSRKLLREPSSLIEALVHEVAHKHSGASDCTRAFENELCNAVAVLVVRHYYTVDHAKEAGFMAAIPAA